MQRNIYFFLFLLACAAWIISVIGLVLSLMGYTLEGESYLFGFFILIPGLLIPAMIRAKKMAPEETKLKINNLFYHCPKWMKYAAIMLWYGDIAFIVFYNLKYGRTMDTSDPVMLTMISLIGIAGFSVAVAGLYPEKQKVN